MANLLVCGFLFLATHFGLSARGVRAGVVSKIGENGFLLLYAVFAIITLTGLIYSYNHAPQSTVLWGPSAELNLVPRILMVLAMIFFLGGFLVKNPTTVGLETILQNKHDASELATGLLRVTRHPFQWSVVLWAGSHIVANGDLVSVVFFAVFGLLAIIGCVVIDAKKAAKLGDDWHKFASVTSNVPFGAIVSGRNQLKVAELWLPVLVGLVGYGAAYWGHQWLSGVPLN